MQAALRYLKTFPLDPLLKAGASLIATNFEGRYPLACQRGIFKELIDRAAATRFGKDHGFAELSSLPFDQALELYRSRVPIRTYADFWNEYFSSGYRAGERSSLTLDNVTWPGKISLFCETSGTTAPTKYIPFSREMFRANKKAALELTACYLHRNRKSRLFQGRLLYMAGNTNLSSLGEGVKSGDMSAITLRYRPSFLKPFIAPDDAVAALPWEDKVEALAHLLLMDRSIHGISGVPPWIILLLKRCRELGQQPLPELLANLELIIHGGTSIKPYRKEFEALFPGPRPQFLEVLPSSEAFMGFQLVGEEQMRLTPYYGAFFEFVPVDRLDDKGTPISGADAVPLEGVETGRRYAVILSTFAGLWRYHIGDTIRFTGLSPHFIEFTGRDRFLDRFEEKVTQEEVEEAVSQLTREGVPVKEFIVGPDIDGRRHLWILAVQGAAQAESPSLSRKLDDAIITMNADYATFRSQGRIDQPLVVTVEEDCIYRWSKEVRGKLGGQTKIPHIDPTIDGAMVTSLAEYCASRADSFHP